MLFYSFNCSTVGLRVCSCNFLNGVMATPTSVPNYIHLLTEACKEYSPRVIALSNFGPMSFVFHGICQHMEDMKNEMEELRGQFSRGFELLRNDFIEANAASIYALRVRYLTLRPRG